MTKRIKKNVLITRIISLLIGWLVCFTTLAQTWSLIQGITAKDIAVGKNGTVWATATNGAIYRWKDASWQTMPGVATNIAVDPDGNAWVVNAGGNIYKYLPANNTWEQKAGSAKDIGIGADGSVWVVGGSQVQGGYEIYKWNGNGWTKIPGGALRIAVDPSGNAWVVNNTGNVFKYNGTVFELKPGGLKDIGVGANGTIWCTGTDGSVYQWNGTDWTKKTGNATDISVSPDGNAWVVNGKGGVFKTTDAATSILVRKIFARGETYEYRMLQALKVSPYTNTVSLTGSVPSYNGIDALGQAFGNLGLLAAEAYAKDFPNATAESVLSDINNFPNIRKEVTGILGVLIMATIINNANDAQTAALKKWATDLYYSIKVRSAKAVLDEYQKWKSDPCTYTAEGYTKPPDCGLGDMNFSQWFGTHSAPQDIIAKAGLKLVLAKNTDAVANGITISVAVPVMAASVAAMTSGLGVATGEVVAGAAVTTSLNSVFGGVGAASVGGVSSVGIFTGPVLAAIVSIVVGTIEGFRVVEQAKVEPMLKMKLGAAISEPINIVNVLAEKNGASMFYLTYQESVLNGFLPTQPQVDGEVRFYCQAGFVTRFQLSYTLNGQTVTQKTNDLPVGHEESFPVPYNATNITVKGDYALAGWKELFTKNLDKPTYMCFTSYGTVFKPTYKTDCPEVGNMTTKANQLTLTQGGGYVAWFKLTYTQNGKTVTLIDDATLSLGWRKVYDIPADATNIRLIAKSKTGLLWSPWKLIVDKTWPTAPNECIKVYNTTLDPKYNNECK